MKNESHFTFIKTTSINCNKNDAKIVYTVTLFGKRPAMMNETKSSLEAQ